MISLLNYKTILLNRECKFSIFGAFCEVPRIVCIFYCFIVLLHFTSSTAKFFSCTKPPSSTECDVSLSVHVKCLQYYYIINLKSKRNCKFDGATISKDSIEMTVQSSKSLSFELLKTKKKKKKKDRHGKWSCSITCFNQCIR